MTNIVCLDLEGVLVPEIWIAVAKKTRIEALKRTTREEPDYDKLMRFRIAILKQNGIRIQDIQKVITTLRPLPGAKAFVEKLRSKNQVIILSDTFYEFAAPLMKQLGWPTIFCNFLEIDSKGFIKRHIMRQHNGKQKAVEALKALNFRVLASGDSYNDLNMLKTADKGILFRPPMEIAKKFKFPVVQTHAQLLKLLR